MVSSSLSTNNESKESLAGVIELPEDDPDILIRFLQFLYTGNYEDGEYPTQDMPATEAIMDADEIRRELQYAPGVLTGGLSGESQDSSLRSQIQSIANDIDEKSDGDYEISSPSTEPDEEYLSGLEDEEADEEDNSEGHEYVESRPVNLFIALRVYVMADKFGVPSLKLLARRRFYNTARKVFHTYSEFPAVVDELYETTAPTDYTIREIPCRLIAASYASNASNTIDFEALMCD
ncbi:uncharacterized protein Triagg1_5541 [Trichoderma aggressivum f. europaeum]|uniref:BTB domain-containing protein n=1 Tax=Trichoderma aggressivum f. europaeum TaxID=173218 RepID=A0AAE1ICG8_9HYPO|nr:hypothetical protein Triagg1_5541 [Trichoderma aggressivum f. europaeum]